MNQISSKRRFVSVIIPVFNDKQRLRLCLDALSRQTYPQQFFEVIIVDNGSEESLSDLVFSYKGKMLLLSEPTPGSYAARNKGIRHAKGEILAFTDSDCIPRANWLENGVEKFLGTPECGLVGGAIELFFKDPKSPTPVEIYDSVEMGFPQELTLSEQRFAYTANVFTSKEIIDKVGPFNDKLKSGGDRDWGRRVFEAGYKQVFSREACVEHPSRYSFEQLYKRITRINGGNFDAEKGQLSTKENLKKLSRDVSLLLTPPFRSVFRVWRDKPKLATNKHRIQFIAVELFVRYVSASERIRLRLGGKSRRW